MDIEKFHNLCDRRLAETMNELMGFAYQNCEPGTAAFEEAAKVFANSSALSCALIHDLVFPSSEGIRYNVAMPPAANRPFYKVTTEPLERRPAHYGKDGHITTKIVHPDDFHRDDTGGDPTN